MTFKVVEGAIASTPKMLPQVIIGLGEEQAEKYVREMYRNPEFSDGVIKPTQRTTIVMIDRFFDFMKWKDDRKFEV